MTGARLVSLGIGLPAREVSNADLARDFGVDPDWIADRTGIRTRRFASRDETASTLGTVAAQAALDHAGLSAAEIDLIICATVTPDWQFPAAACLIQASLGCDAAAFDLNAGCSGWLVALAQATASIEAGLADRVLVVGTEVLSRITDFGDKKSAALFGDGAGAAILEKVDGGTSVGPFTIHSDGRRPELLHVPADTGKIHMQGLEVYRAAVLGMSHAIADVLQSSGTSLDDVDMVVAHQANARILDAVAARLGCPPEKMFSNIDRYGNTSAASIPIALAEAHAAGRLSVGDVVVLAAFGAGFVWGAGLVQWQIGPVTTSDELARSLAHA